MQRQRFRLGTLWLLMSWMGGTGCAVIATSVDEVADPAAEWTQAQRDVAALTPSVSGNPFAVSMGQFVIETEERPFICGNTGLHAFLLVYGCFWAEPQGSLLGVIRHVPNQGALRHEARHAILFALGDSRWPYVGH